MKKKILIFCPIGIGNYLMATPAINRLHAEMPTARLSLLALKPGIKQLAEHSNWFHKIYFWDPDVMGMGAGLKILRSIRRQDFDIALGFFPTNHWKFALFMMLSRSKKRLGFDYVNGKIIQKVLTQKVPYLPSHHDVEKNLKLVQTGFGLKALPNPHLIFPRDYLAPLPVPNQPFFVCHPGSSAERNMHQKRWPASEFASLIKLLFKETACRCVLIGGPEEEGLRNQISGLCGEAVLQLPTKSLGECAALIAGSKFFLGNDSGLMHMAVSLGKRCIALFGPSDEERTGPYFLEGDSLRDEPHRGHLILRSPLDKNRLGSKTSDKLAYEGKSHLQSLKAEEVWPQVKKDFLEKYF